MAKTPRTTEAFHFQDFPVDDLEIRPPSHVVESLFGIPGLKGLREPFINLSPNKGEWLRTCFDIEVDHISTLKDGNGVPRAFKLVVDVEGNQEIFMNKINKQFHRLFLESLQERGEPIPKVEWHPILMEKGVCVILLSQSQFARDNVEDLQFERRRKTAHRKGMGLYQRCPICECQGKTCVCSRPDLA